MISTILTLAAITRVPPPALGSMSLNNPADENFHRFGTNAVNNPVKILLA